VAHPISSLTNEIHVIHAGLVEYHNALATQREIHSEVSQSSLENTLILLEHPSVYTAGRRTLDNEKPMDGTPVVDVDRGGKITWHGPGQLVGYPIVRLANPHELVGFVRTIEAGLIQVCKEFGITTQCISKRSGVFGLSIVAEKEKLLLSEYALLKASPCMALHSM
jgi:lipoyl(octanoyl) transferase